jgi:hypothetical protein
LGLTWPFVTVKRMDEKIQSRLENCVHLWIDACAGSEERDAEDVEPGDTIKNLQRELNWALSLPLWQLFYPLARVGTADCGPNESFVTFLVREPHTSFFDGSMDDTEMVSLQKHVRNVVSKRILEQVIYL